MRLYTIVLMLVLSLTIAGCAGSNSEGGSDPLSSGLTYYYSEFPDVAIPNEMLPEKSDTFISFAGDGTKLGTQYFKGRVELASLVNAMYGHMQRDNWSMRSQFRANRSAIMIFEQPGRMCSIYMHEDMISTGMLIFVSPRLTDGAIQYSVPSAASTEPLLPSDPVISSDMSAAPAASPVPMASPAPSASPTPSASSAPSASNGNITVYPAM